MKLSNVIIRCIYNRFIFGVTLIQAGSHYNSVNYAHELMFDLMVAESPPLYVL